MEANYDTRKFSIARWQPKGCNFPTLNYLAPYKSFGIPIKGIQPNEYRMQYEHYVLSDSAIQHTLRKFILSMNDDESVAFMCWCNPSRQSTHEKLFCHRILVGYWIEENIPGVEVIYEDGADNPIWGRNEHS